MRRFNASHKVEVSTFGRAYPLMSALTTMPAQVLYLWVLGFAELEYDDFELCMSHPRKILSDREVGGALGIRIDPLVLIVWSR